LELKRNIVWLPAPIWTAVQKIAQLRGISRNDLLVERATRYLIDPDYALQVEKSVCDLMAYLSNESPQWDWPVDPIECLVLSWRLSEWIDLVTDEQIPDLESDELAYWNDQVKKTGRELSDLIQERILKPDWERTDEADWWKRDLGEQ
jgi:hypothetical protein